MKRMKNAKGLPSRPCIYSNLRAAPLDPGKGEGSYKIDTLQNTNLPDQPQTETFPSF